MTSLAEEPAYMGAIVETVPHPLLVIDPDLVVLTANEAFRSTFALAEGDVIGRPLRAIGGGGWDVPELVDALRRVRDSGNAVRGLRLERSFGPAGRRIVLLSADRLATPQPSGRILLAVTDVTEREELRFRLEGEKEFSNKLIDSIREGLVVLGEDLVVRSANTSFYQTFRVAPEETVGRRVYDLGNGQWNIPELLERILPRQDTFDDFEVTHRFRGIGQRTMLLNARRLDHTNLILLAIRDVTELRRRDANQATFVAELQHRIRNILNNVRSMAVQTARGADSVEAFLAAFEARMGALARTQDLLVEATSRPIPLDALVARELGAVGADPIRTYASSGPDVPLDAERARAISMILHELATNAGKYGALATPGGRIAITWRREARDGGDWLAIEWRESGVRIEDTAPAEGFGSRVIAWIVPHMLRGTADLRLHEDGAACAIAFPLFDGDLGTEG